MKTFTSIEDLARRFLVEEMPGTRRGLAPFALQRFMQGRCFELCFQGSNQNCVWQIGVLKWAFAWNKENDATQIIPPRFSLPVANGKSPASVPFCEKCWNGSGTNNDTLREHARFDAEQKRAIELFGNDWNVVSEVLPQPKHVEPPDSSKYFWRAVFKGVIGDCGNPHELFVLAELELTPIQPDPHSGVPIAEERKMLAERLSADIHFVLKLLTGDCAVAQHETALVVRHTVPSPTRSCRPPAIGAADGLPQHEAQAVDRFLQRCRQISTNPQEFDPLTVLLMRRCGDDPKSPGAQVRFAFGYDHWARIEVPPAPDILHVAQRLQKRVLDFIDQSAGQGRKVKLDKEAEHGKIILGLEALGFTRANAYQATEANLVPFDGLVHPEKSVLDQNVRNALRASNPVDSVVSNRIMAACVAEQVSDLWESADLIETLERYSRATLICEMSVLPESVGELLFYVPLAVPPSRRKEELPTSNFLSYAVAMCPPQVIAQEDFREVVRACNQDIYLGFLETTLQGLQTASVAAKECHKLVLTDSPYAKEQFLEAVNAGNRLLADLLRLADFYPPYESVFEDWSSPIWKDSRPSLLCATPPQLTHASILSTCSETLQNTYERALSPIGLKRLLESRRLAGTEHSGLMKPLEDACAMLVSLQSGITDKSLNKSLRELESRLRLVHERWSLFDRRYLKGVDAQTIRWRFVQHNAQKSAALFEMAKAALPAICKRHNVEFLTRNSATFSAELIGHSIFEEEAALIEIFVNLLSNLAIHEKTRILSGSQWGISLSWVTEQTLRKIGPFLEAAYENWHPQLKNGGAVLIRAYPTTLEDEKLQSRLRALSLGGHSSNQGLWSLMTITQAYDVVWQQDEQDRKRDAQTPVMSSDAAFLILVPGTQSKGTL